jgi:hypothetical protein
MWKSGGGFGVDCEFATVGFDEAAVVALILDLGGDGGVEGVGRRLAVARLPEALLDDGGDDLLTTERFIRSREQLGGCFEQAQRLGGVSAALAYGRDTFRRVAFGHGLGGLGRLLGFRGHVGAIVDPFPQALGALDPDGLAGLRAGAFPSAFAVCTVDLDRDYIAGHLDHVDGVEFYIVLLHSDSPIILVNKEQSAAFAEYGFDLFDVAVGKEREHFDQLFSDVAKVTGVGVRGRFVLKLSPVGVEFHGQPMQYAVDVPASFFVALPSRLCGLVGSICCHGLLLVQCVSFTFIQPSFGDRSKANDPLSRKNFHILRRLHGRRRNAGRGAKMIEGLGT